MLRITAWHDNTSANKANPDPNQWVGWGERTVDEMISAADAEETSERK